MELPTGTELGKKIYLRILNSENWTEGRDQGKLHATIYIKNKKKIERKIDQSKLILANDTIS